MRSLRDIVKCGGGALKSMAPRIIQHLISAASELEPEVFNYAQFHVDSKEELEAARARAAASSGSLIMTSLDRLLPLIDHDISEEVTSVLVHLTRTSVGIPSRVATSQFIQSFCVGSPAVARPHSHRLMDATEGALYSERSCTYSES